MQRVSSNMTLFLKLFIPTFWVVFFGITTLALFFYDFKYAGDIPASYLKWLAVLVYLGSLLLIYATLIQLKRVEMGPRFVYVTDYFKNYRYPYHNVRAMKVYNFYLFRLARLEFKVPGSFGKRIFFIPNARRLEDFLMEHPEVSFEIGQTS